MRRDLLRIWDLPVKADPRCQSVEREFCLNRLGGESHVTVMARDPAEIRGLLAQPEFVATGACVARIGRTDCLVGIQGRLPLACIRIGAPRRDGRPSRVFARRGGRGRGARVCRIDTDSGTPVTRDEAAVQ